MPIIPEAADHYFKHRWSPTRELGQGGGGKVYQCVRRDSVEKLTRFNSRSGGISLGAGERESMSADVIDALYDDFRPNGDGIAAVKVPHAMDDPGNRERFKREITAMRSCVHPALIRLIDCDSDANPRWFAMELHSGGILKDRVEVYKGNPLECLEAIRPVIEGAAKLHKGGYIHRDIKPNNVFITSAGGLVLGDLGIVFPTHEQEERITPGGDTLFSRDWIPDWIRFSDAPPETKVDVFMLAKVIYYMITGGRRVLASQLSEPANDLRLLYPQASGIEQLYDLLANCITTRERECKFLNASELLCVIDELIGTLRGSYRTQLLFNFLSNHSTSHIVIFRPNLENSSYPQLAGIQIYVPFRCRRFRARARVISPGPTYEINTGFSIDNQPSNTITGTYPRRDPGSWTDEVVLNPSQEIGPGWHTLDLKITSAADGGSVTGFMLYGE